MIRMYCGLCIALCLSGCPDVDKYVTDAAVDSNDSAPVMDSTIEPDGAHSNLDIGIDAALIDSAVPSDVGSTSDVVVPAPDAQGPLDLGAAIDATPLDEDGGIMVADTCEVTFRVSLPQNTPEGDIFIAGQGLGVAEWEPNEPDLRMTRVAGDGHWVTTLGHLSRVTYKYTRGEWASVESTAACAEIDNRSVVIDCGGGTVSVEDTVLGWVDRCL